MLKYVLNGCMIMGMHGGMMGGSHKESQTAEPSPVLVKESVVGNVKVIVEYPPARVAITTCTVSSRPNKQRRGSRGFNSNTAQTKAAQVMMSPHVAIVERLASVVTY